MHTYVTRKYRARKCSRESLYKWIVKHKLLDLNMIDWKYLQARYRGNLGSGEQLTTAKGKNEEKRGRNLKRSRATLTCRAEGMVDLPMNTQTLRHCKLLYVDAIERDAIVCYRNFSAIRYTKHVFLKWREFRSLTYKYNRLRSIILHESIIYIQMLKCEQESNNEIANKKIKKP